jgi:hypothetical protein
MSTVIRAEHFENLQTPSFNLRSRTQRCAVQFSHSNSVLRGAPVLLLAGAGSLACGSDFDGQLEQRSSDLQSGYHITPQVAAYDAAAVPAGATICVDDRSGSGSLLIKNVAGQPGTPILISNCEGSAVIPATNGNYALSISNSKYFKLSGRGTGLDYGLELDGRQALTNTTSRVMGLTIGGLSSNFEVESVYVHDVGFAGIMAKTDPGNICTEAENPDHRYVIDTAKKIVRDTFVQHDTHLHHNKVVGTANGEGFYIGYTGYTGNPVDNDACAGWTKYGGPLDGVDLHDNIVENTGAEGLQLGSADQGTVRVHGNRVTDPGQRPFEAHQDNGIQIGAGTTGDLYDNQIFNAGGNGIILLGLGDNRIFDNLVVDSGGSGIFADDRPDPLGVREDRTNAPVDIFNNTIVTTSTGSGIEIRAGFTYSVRNNLIVNPGSYDLRGDPGAFLYQGGFTSNDPPVDLGAPANSATSGSNLFVRAVADAGFVNPAASNYDLSASSGAIDHGSDISGESVTQDLLGRPRRSGPRYDVGAFEYQQAGGGGDGAAFTQDFSSSSSVSAYVNAASPSSGQFNSLAAETSGGTWSVQAGRLQLVRQGASGPDAGAGLERWTDLGSSPALLYVRFDVGVTSWTISTSQNDALCFDVGNFAGHIDYSSGGAAVNVYNSLCVDGRGSGSFGFESRGVSSAASYSANGTMYAVSYFLNKSPSAATYRGPDGSLYPLDAGRVAVWVGTTRQIDNVVAANGSSSALSDFRVRWGQPENGTWFLDNLAVSTSFPQ